MSGPTRKRQPEPVIEAEKDTQSSGLTGALDSRTSNTDIAAQAERAQTARQLERELRLPDLGAPTKTFWQEAMTDAFHDGLRGFVRSVPEQGGDLDDLGDAAVKFAGSAAESLVKSGFEEMGGAAGALDFAKEYPVPAALLAGALGYGASEWLDGKPRLKLKVKLSPISDHLTAEGSHDLDSGESSFMLRFKYEW